MFDMRYHIASLVAVFLALTVGLLLGSLIADKGVLADRQEKLVESIRADVSKINEENVALRTKLEDVQAFQDEVLPVAIKNRLLDKQVMIVGMRGGQEEQVNSIKKALELAGAKTYSMQIKTKNLSFGDKNLVARLGTKFGADGAQGGAFESLFWPRVAAELAGKEPPALIDELKLMDLIEIDDGSLSVENIVVLAPGEKEVSHRDALFVEALVGVGGIRVVGVETDATKPSRMATYKLRNVSTVDNIETVPGQISLVYLLENRDVTAHFGAKATADKLLP